MSEENSSIFLRFGNNVRSLDLVLQRRSASFFQAKPPRFDTNSGLKENVFPPEDCTCQIKAAAILFFLLLILIWCNPELIEPLETWIKIFE